MLHLDARPTQVMIHLDPEDLDRANLWFPEIVEVGDAGQFMEFANVPGHPIAWTEVPGKLSYGVQVPDSLALSASIQSDESGFTLEMEVGNLTGEMWGKVHTCVCMQLTTAQSLVDLTRERTYCVVDGELVAMADLEMVGKGKPTFYFAVLPGHAAPLRHSDPNRDGAKWLLTKSSPDHGFICTTSADGSKTVWMGWEDVQYLQTNTMPSYACIHANPFFGDIAAGESVRRRGRIGVAPGPAESALQEYLEEFGS